MKTWKQWYWTTISLIALFSQAIQAAPTPTELAVWVNEAIVATYTYDYQNFVAQQKAIASYFTSDGWINYSQALLNSKLPETIQANNYKVSAVAQLPPEVNALSSTTWEANMPLLVVYKNPQYQQKQTLAITVRFVSAPTDQGVRGLAITSLQAKETIPPCQCEPSPQQKQINTK